MRLPFSRPDNNVIKLPKPFNSHSREDSSGSSNASLSASASAYAYASCTPASPNTPTTPTTPNQPIKAKRKRANPSQLERLQQCYDMNPFPSNEERQCLAIELGMSPNSVRIWYQNKRQALRNYEKSQSVSP